MNKIAVAKELVKVARSLVGQDEDWFSITIPASRIFHQTDFDVADFEDEVTAILKRVGSDVTLVHSRMLQGLWQLEWMVSRDADLLEAERLIGRMPEWRLLEKYGAGMSYE